MLEAQRVRETSMPDMWNVLTAKNPYDLRRSQINNKTFNLRPRSYPVRARRPRGACRPPPRAGRGVYRVARAARRAWSARALATLRIGRHKAQYPTRHYSGEPSSIMRRRVRLFGSVVISSNFCLEVGALAPMMDRLATAVLMRRFRASLVVFLLLIAKGRVRNSVADTHQP